MGMAYLSIVVGVLLGAAVYFVLIFRSFTSPLLRNEGFTLKSTYLVQY